MCEMGEDSRAREFGLRAMASDRDESLVAPPILTAVAAAHGENVLVRIDV